MGQTQLRAELLQEANDYVKKLIGGVDFIVEAFLAGREDKALEVYVDFVDGIVWILQVLESTQSVAQELGVDINLGGHLNSQLEEIVSALENRDYVLVGDLLNYEIKPIIQSWQNSLSEVSGRMKANGLFN